MLPVVPPFLLGLLVAPLVKRVAKPVFQGAVKMSVGIALDARRAMHSAGEELRDLTAEALADEILAESAVEASGSSDGQAGQRKKHGAAASKA